jgi:hypothetical protein
MKLIVRTAFVAGLLLFTVNSGKADGFSQQLGTQLDPFGGKIVSQSAANGAYIYYYKFDKINFPETDQTMRTFPLVVAITCAIMLAGGGYCSVGSVTGLPPSFPLALILPNGP